MLENFTSEFKNDASFLMLYNGQEIMEGGGFKDKDAIISIMKGYSSGTNSNSQFKSDEIINGTIELDNITLQYGIVIPSDEFMGKYYDALRVLLLLTFIVAVALLLMAIPLKNGIWSPIKELVSLMKHLGQGNLGVQAKRNTKDEFELIFQSFNNMSSEIKYLFDVVYKEELARKEAQLTALQARINPHFLYNTLEIMNWKARISGNQELSEMIEALGTLMDASMDRGGEGVCKLSDEIRLIDSYIYIMNKRFGKRLRISKQIDETLMDTIIPKLIVQPLLENAVIHGIEPLGGGEITVTVKRASNDLAIEVADNGTGMDDGDIEEYNKLFTGQESKFGGSTGIGIRNVNERIKLLYGESYGLSLKKGEHGGTIASIHITPRIPEQKRALPSNVSRPDIPEPEQNDIAN
jgi:two-component system sensor histidine kinase YesM